MSLKVLNTSKCHIAMTAPKAGIEPAFRFGILTYLCPFNCSV